MEKNPIINDYLIKREVVDDTVILKENSQRNDELIPRNSYPGNFFYSNVNERKKESSMIV